MRALRAAQRAQGKAAAGEAAGGCLDVTVALYLANKPCRIRREATARRRVPLQRELVEVARGGGPRGLARRCPGLLSGLIALHCNAPRFEDHNRPGRRHQQAQPSPALLASCAVSFCLPSLPSGNAAGNADALRPSLCFESVKGAANCCGSSKSRRLQQPPRALPPTIGQPPLCPAPSPPTKSPSATLPLHTPSCLSAPHQSCSTYIEKRWDRKGEGARQSHKRDGRLRGKR